MTSNTVHSTKKVVAGGIITLGLVGFGLCAGVGVAAADGTHPDSGSYDPTVEVNGDGHIVPIKDEDATQGEWDHDGTRGDQDEDGIQGTDNVVKSTAWVPGWVTGH
jgi:hypothetical protein